MKKQRQEFGVLSRLLCEAVIKHGSTKSHYTGDLCKTREEVQPISYKW